MRVIILEGPSSSGKTTTLQMLYATLIINKAEILCPPSMVGDKDFETMLVYKNKKVAIFSQGDYTKNCKEAIVRHAEDSVDVLIMAHSSNLSELKVPPPHTKDTKEKTVAEDCLSRMMANVKDCEWLEKAI